MAERGVGLMLDFVPNHIARDSPSAGKRDLVVWDGTRHEVPVVSSEIQRSRAIVQIVMLSEALFQTKPEIM